METKYHSEFYDELRDGKQWIRLSDGCHRSCDNCRCPSTKVHYPLPPIRANKVCFLDMNFLSAYPHPKDLLESLPTRLNGKVIHYSFLCGFDYSLLTGDILRVLRRKKVGWFNTRRQFRPGIFIAWDRGIREEKAIDKQINMILSCGFTSNNITCFMLCNYRIPFTECIEKLKVLADWEISVSDCWFDNQLRGNVSPVHWTEKEIKTFGRLCRAHNIAVRHRLYPSIKKIYHLSYFDT